MIRLIHFDIATHLIYVYLYWSISEGHPDGDFLSFTSLTRFREVGNLNKKQGSKLGKTTRSQLAPRYFFLGANIDN